MLIIGKVGYWGGISPTGKIAKEYKTRQVRTKGGLFGGTMTVVDADDIQRFYDDFYRYLSEFLAGITSDFCLIVQRAYSCLRFLHDAGIDSVKTDSQFILDELHDAEDRARLTKAYQDAWMISSLRHFSIKVISCIAFDHPSGAST